MVVIGLGTVWILAALREAVDEGAVKRLRGGEYAPSSRRPDEHARDRSR